MRWDAVGASGQVVSGRGVVHLCVIVSARTASHGCTTCPAARVRRTHHPAAESWRLACPRNRESWIEAAVSGLLAAEIHDSREGGACGTAVGCDGSFAHRMTRPVIPSCTGFSPPICVENPPREGITSRLVAGRRRAGSTWTWQAHAGGPLSKLTNTARRSRSTWPVWPRSSTSEGRTWSRWRLGRC